TLMAHERAVRGEVPDPGWPRYAALCCAGYAIAAGLITLAGWALNQPRLTDWRNNGVSMFPNPAACAVLAGGAIVLVNVAALRARVLVRWSAALIALVGLLTLFEHLTGVDVGIDRLLIDRTWGQFAAAAPMRMGPPGSLSLSLTGAALLLLTFGAR